MTPRLSARRLVNQLPTSRLLYKFCKHYVDHYRGENNCDMRTNGEQRYLRSLLPECTIVFDVGANTGDWTAMALDVNPALHIHCFEPSAAPFHKLRMRNFAESQVTLNPIGLSASTGEATLHVFADSAGINSLYVREGLSARQASTEQVRLDTLDAYCQQLEVLHIDLLKLDVEGHELMVLQGATQMLSQGRIRHIQFEYGGTFIDARVLLKDIFKLLTSTGYRLFRIHPSELQFAASYNQQLEDFQYQNWIAIRS